MERESFESESTAAILNEFFVSIKVDREERPDVDRVYMTALQAMGESGGWPLSMFLTPDLKPFYGGTYFPPETRYGRYGFPQILHQVHEAWQKEHEKILASAEEMVSALNNRSSPGATTEMLGEQVFDACFDHFVKTYDSSFGGFGGAPKFPRPSVLQFLLMHGYERKAGEPIDMVLHTLERMRSGGVYDQLGGGFHRYSVDAEWRVPHFEKMLYDQAQIVMAAADAYRATRSPLCLNTIEETLEYVLRDMRGSEGGFFSAEDADSPDPDGNEPTEGAFYVWKKSEIQEALPDGESDLFAFAYGVREEGNAMSDPHHEFLGKNILYHTKSIEETAGAFNQTPAATTLMLAKARRALLNERVKRKRPFLDDKVLTSWNGLMISALARSYQVFNKTNYLDAAVRASDFVMTKLYNRSEGTLWRRYRDGESKFDAHLEDYAFFVQGLIDLHESTGEVQYLRDAVALTGKQIEMFWDERDGGFFDTFGRDSSILLRTKEFYDGAEPSGNAVAILNLVKLSTISDRQDFLEKAGKSFSYFKKYLNGYPHVMPFMVFALSAFHSQPKQVVIIGARQDHRTALLQRAAFQSSTPHRVVLTAEPGDQQRELSSVAPFVGTLKQLDEQPTAFVCENFVCNLPTTDPTRLTELLNSRGAGLS